jgi:hypothetical protein
MRQMIPILKGWSVITQADSFGRGMPGHPRQAYRARPRNRVIPTYSTLDAFDVVGLQQAATGYTQMPV